MSTDFNAVCDACRLYRHAGQRMGLGLSLGYGTGDPLAEEILKFMFDHLFCEPEIGVRVVLSDQTPPGYINVEP
jgi:hypothetical protein